MVFQCPASRCPTLVFTADVAIGCNRVPSCKLPAWRAPTSIGSPNGVPVPWHSICKTWSHLCNTKNPSYRKHTTVFCQQGPNLLNSFDVKLNHLASWCFNFASINAVWTTSVWDGPLGAVIVELMPSWFTAMPRSAAWDCNKYHCLSFPWIHWGKTWNHKVFFIYLYHLIIYPYWSAFITQFFKAFFGFLSSRIWWANQLGSTLEPSHVHPVDDKASQHLCSCSEKL